MKKLFTFSIVLLAGSNSYATTITWANNMFPAAPINGAWQPGVSTGDVLRTMEGLANKELPRSMSSEWTELSYLQKQSSKVEQFRDLRQNPFSAFVLGSVLVFLVLAGLYEGWSLPLAVILVVPMCVLCALTGVAVRGLDNNIFTRVGFVVLIGLACKNAILIVEFARDRQQEGASRSSAALPASERPRSYWPKVEGSRPIEDDVPKSPRSPRGRNSSSPCTNMR